MCAWPACQWARHSRFACAAVAKSARSRWWRSLRPRRRPVESLGLTLRAHGDGCRSGPCRARIRRRSRRTGRRRRDHARRRDRGADPGASDQGVHSLHVGQRVMVAVTRGDDPFCDDRDAMTPQLPGDSSDSSGPFDPGLGLRAGDAERREDRRLPRARGAGCWRGRPPRRRWRSCSWPELRSAPAASTCFLRRLVPARSGRARCARGVRRARRPESRVIAERTTAGYWPGRVSRPAVTLLVVSAGFGRGGAHADVIAHPAALDPDRWPAASARPPRSRCRPPIPWSRGRRRTRVIELGVLLPNRGGWIHAGVAARRLFRRRRTSLWRRPPASPWRWPRRHGCC